MINVAQVVIFGRKKAKTTLEKSKYTGYNPVGNIHFSPDGQNLYISNRQFFLSNAWEIDSMSYVRSSNISMGGTGNRSYSMSPDGTMYFTVSYANNIINAYTLTTPYNIATMVFANSFTVTTPTDVKFSPDGTKMIVGFANTLRQYDLSTPWDISTASLLVTKTITNQLHYSFTISTDGFVLITQKGNYLCRFTMQDAFDITNLQFSNSIYLPTSVYNYEGIFLSNDGMKLYYSLYNANPNLYQFSNSLPNKIG